MTNAIYFDMDGTIADLYGFDGWLDYLHAEDVKPYAEARPLVDMDALNAICEALAARGVVIGVISWTAMGGSREYNAAVRKAKRAWINEYLPCVSEFHVVKYGTPKHHVRKVERSILVDDNADVREAWRGETIDATKDILNALSRLLGQV